MTVVDEDRNAVTLRMAEAQTSLRLQNIDTAIERKTAGGRIAFACPTDDVQRIETLAKSTTIHTPYTALETPGKATVHVVILCDPVSICPSRH